MSPTRTLWHRQISTGIFRTRAARLLVAVVCLLLLTAREAAADFPGTVILGRPTNSSVTVNLLASTALTVFVEYGTQSGAFTAQSPQYSLLADQPLEIELRSLPSATRTYYRVRFRASQSGDFGASPEYSFMTQRPAGSTFTFCIQGDSHPEREQNQFNAVLYRRTLLTAAADRPDFYMTIGDDFSVDTLSSLTKETVTQRYLIQRPYLSLVANSAPLFLVNGNHEQAAAYLLNGTADNVAVWAQNARNRNFPQPAPDSFFSGDEETVDFIGHLRDYYAWTWGDALFVVIDPYWHSPVAVDNVLNGGSKRSNMWELTLGDTQYQWLKKTLEGSTARHKFVFAHHVNGTGRGGVEIAGLYEWGGKKANGTWGFSDNRPGWSLPIHQLMTRNGVTVFFQGHDHIFAHQQLDGVTYQTLPEPADPNYALYNSNAFSSGIKYPNSGYTRVTVSPEGVKVEYVRTYLPEDEGAGKVNGTVAHSYSLGTLSTIAAPSKLTALSVRSRAGTGDQTLIAGIAVSQGEPLPVLVRGLGPSLAAFGITGFLPDTLLTVFSATGASLATNDDWSSGSESGLLAATFTRIGAAALTSGSLDAALVSSFAPGVYTAHLACKSDSSGVALVEIFDAATLDTCAHLTGVSARTQIGSGDAVLIAGFVISGSSPKQILLRALGPKLSSSGVAGALADPQLQLFQTGMADPLQENDNWGEAGNADDIAAATARVGCPSLPVNSLDAAMLVTLTPGVYTAHVSSTDTNPGVGLVEIYEVP